MKEREGCSLVHYLSELGSTPQGSSLEIPQAHAQLMWHVLGDGLHKEGKELFGEEGGGGADRRRCLCFVGGVFVGNRSILKD